MDTYEIPVSFGLPTATLLILAFIAIHLPSPSAFRAKSRTTPYEYLLNPPQFPLSNAVEAETIGQPHSNKGLSNHENASGR